MDKIRASVIGASGYTGGELLRLLLAHPNMDVASVSSEKSHGLPVSRIHPNLRAMTGLSFVKAAEIDTDVDAVFLCTPHGASAPYVERFADSGIKIIDLSSDFRLRDPAAYPMWYGHDAPSGGFNGKFVYGIPELHRDEIRKSKWVACAGCIATSAILGLAPLVNGDIVDESNIVVDAKIGSSGAGATANESSHHPERSNTVRAYKMTMHRHTGEVEQELSSLSGGNVTVSLSAHAVELVRGIFSTCHCALEKSVSDLDVWKAYRAFYKGSPFIRLVKEKECMHRYPEPKLVLGTNFCDIGFEIDAHSPRLVVMSCIDNLVKGSAGQAVQCCNLMSGLDEKTGLWTAGLHPV